MWWITALIESPDPARPRVIPTISPFSLDSRGPPAEILKGNHLSQLQSPKIIIYEYVDKRLHWDFDRAMKG